MSAKRKRPRSGQGRAAATNTTPHSSANTPPSPCPLDQKHRDELYTSGLSDETIATAGIYSAGGEAITGLLGWKPKETHWPRSMVFPYAATEPQYCRVKPDYPRFADGSPIKYESPRNQGNRAYLTRGCLCDINSDKPMLIVEGEKKTLAAWQAGYRAIGIAGAWAWQQRRKRSDHGKAYGDRKLIPDLASIDWKGRRVTIVFDSDAAENDKVQLAQARLAEVLTAAGASVSVATIPPEGDKKVGLDDFLVAHGVDELRKLIEAAKPSELPKPANVYELAQSLVDDQFRSRDGEFTLRWHREVFWFWSGFRYQEYPIGDLRGAVLRWMHLRGLDAKPKVAKEIIECLASICQVPSKVSMPRFLKGVAGTPPPDSSNIIAFLNGLLRVKDAAELTRIPHTATWFSAAILHFPFDPDATCPRWLAFLDQVFDGDSERIALLQEWFGLCLIADTSYQKLMLLVGPKRSGKGTVCRILQHIVGEEQCTSPSLSSLGDPFGLWPLLDKTIAILADAHLGRGADAIRIMETIKGITGEDPQNVNRKNLSYVKNVRLSVRFTISVNELPHFNDSSGAFSSRLLVLPFFRSFAGQEDRGLEARLKSEAPGIVIWSLAGLRRLRLDGRFTDPRVAQTVMQNYARLTSPISGFLEEFCVIDVNESVSTEDAYFAWCTWSKQEGHAHTSSSTFGEKLRSANPQIEKKRLRKDPSMNGGKDRIYVYAGMTLNDDGIAFAVKGRDDGSK